MDYNRSRGGGLRKGQVKTPKKGASSVFEQSFIEFERKVRKVIFNVEI